MDATLKTSGAIPPTGDQFLSEWRRVTRRNLIDNVAVPIVGIARGLAPEFHSVYKASLTYDVRVVSPSFIVCDVFSEDAEIKASVIEGVDQNGVETAYGRQPGRFPPVDIMIAYAAERTGLSGSLLRSVAFLFGRKIARDGIPPVRPIKRAVEMKQPVTDDVFANLIPAELQQSF